MWWLFNLIPAACVVILALVVNATKPTEDSLIDDSDNNEEKKDKKRSQIREYLVYDIRAANHYCAIYVALVGVVGTIVASNSQLLDKLDTGVHIFPFAVAIVAAAIGMLFIPVGFGRPAFTRLRIIWFRSIICQHITLLFVTWGFLTSMFSLLLGISPAAKN